MKRNFRRSQPDATADQTEQPAAPPQMMAMVQLHGSLERILAIVEEIAQNPKVEIELGDNEELPPEFWEQVPVRVLNATEQALVREDLRSIKSEQIARTLGISPSTISAHRTNIRRKFNIMPEHRRPAWVQAWLRRFPGSLPDSYK
ncbi:MAG: hypothetical protein OHK0022_57970 [Roseiflexaceae bacterium]